MNRSPVRVDGKETLRRLKEGARSLFAANGYRGVSIPMIAKMVGIKTPHSITILTTKRQFTKILSSPPCLPSKERCHSPEEMISKII